jgi:2-dehydro-3-deoxyphosphogalactonate aldolase
MKFVNWKPALTSLPLIAILRGIRPENASTIIGALCQAGFRAVEVPLNSPQPLKSIEIAAREFADDLLVGAGTVLRPKDVHGVREAGGQFIVSPNTDPEVITATKSLGLVSVPGVSTSHMSSAIRHCP